MKITNRTKLNAVFGNPLSHSLSPQLHNWLYDKLGIDNVMLAFETCSIKDIIRTIKTLNIGLSAITIPYKEKIIKYLDNIDDTASLIGSVNTVINHNDKLYGYNTDIIGIKNSLKNIKLQKKKTLVLGAGGSAKAVAFFANSRKAHLYIFDPIFLKAKLLAEKYHGHVIKSFNKTEAFDIIINCTPVGTYPKSNKMAIRENWLMPGQVVFDLVYNPKMTYLLKKAKNKKSKIIAGQNMFIHQAVEQVKLWLKFNDQKISFRDTGKLAVAYEKKYGKI